MTFNWDDYIFIDTETTGLDHHEYALLEVTYAVGLGEPVTLYPSDINMDIVLPYADPAALKVNKFIERHSVVEGGRWYNVPRGFGTDGPGANAERDQAYLHVPVAQDGDWDKFAAALKGRTWVGANPRFDVNFIEDYYYPEHLEYHYHLFDVRAWWKGVNGSVDMKARDDVPPFELDENERTRLPRFFNKRMVEAPDTGYRFITADHSSLNDVLAMRQAFVIRAWQNIIPGDDMTDDDLIHALNLIF